jgi:hypothetical protein
MHEIIISGPEVVLEKQRFSVPEFCGLISKHTISGLDEKPIPDNVRWIARSGPYTSYIIELQPELRSIDWLGKRRTVATPYVVLWAMLVGEEYYTHSQLYYRNQPLTSLDDQLYHSNLLNVSYPTDVLCLGNFSTSGRPSKMLGDMVDCLWGSPFSKSYEENNLDSCYTRCRNTEGFDPRVTDITRWAAASKKDPSFVLGVDWLPSSDTPRSLLTQYLGAPGHVSHIGNILLQSKLMSYCH